MVLSRTFMVSALAGASVAIKLGEKSGSFLETTINKGDDKKADDEGGCFGGCCTGCCGDDEEKNKKEKAGNPKKTTAATPAPSKKTSSVSPSKKSSSAPPTPYTPEKGQFALHYAQYTIPAKPKTGGAGTIADDAQTNDVMSKLNALADAQVGLTDADNGKPLRFDIVSDAARAKEDGELIANYISTLAVYKSEEAAGKAIAASATQQTELDGVVDGTPPKPKAVIQKFQNVQYVNKISPGTATKDSDTQEGEVRIVEVATFRMYENQVAKEKQKKELLQRVTALQESCQKATGCLRYELWTGAVFGDDGTTPVSADIGEIMLIIQVFTKDGAANHVPNKVAELKAYNDYLAEQPVALEQEMAQAHTQINKDDAAPNKPMAIRTAPTYKVVVSKPPPTA